VQKLRTLYNQQWSASYRKWLSDNRVQFVSPHHPVAVPQPVLQPLPPPVRQPAPTATPVSTPIVTPAASHVAASGLGEVPGQARKEQAAAEEDAAQADVLAFLSHANPGVFPTPTPVSSSAGHVEHSEHAQNFHPDDGAAAYADDEAFGGDAAFEEELADARAVQPPQPKKYVQKMNKVKAAKQTSGVNKSITKAKGKAVVPTDAQVLENTLPGLHIATQKKKKKPAKKLARVPHEFLTCSAKTKTTTKTKAARTKKAQPAAETGALLTVREC
jgi:hypothetical protein